MGSASVTPLNINVVTFFRSCTLGQLFSCLYSFIIFLVVLFTIHMIVSLIINNNNNNFSYRIVKRNNYYIC